MSGTQKYVHHDNNYIQKYSIKISDAPIEYVLCTKYKFLKLSCINNTGVHDHRSLLGITDIL